MLYKIKTLKLLITSLAAMATSNLLLANKDTLRPNEMVTYGRTANSAQNIELISSASHFGFQCNDVEFALQVQLSYEGEHSFLHVEIDGNHTNRVRIDGHLPQVLRLPTGSKAIHNIWIYKATEAHTGPIFINNVIAKDIKPLKKDNLPFIEFIGNSITCGAASDASDTPCGVGQYHDQHNAYMAYGPRIARLLNTNFMLSSVSGIGIYRNWNSDGPTMPQVYEKTDFQLHGSRSWDFNKYDPNIVSIALGTNDFSDGDGKTARLPFDSAQFVNSYVEFVKQVKSKYPKSKIILLGSPMLDGPRREQLQNCLLTIKKNIDILYSKDIPIFTYFFKPMKPEGCSWHPNIEDHRKIAEELLPTIKHILQN